MNTNEFKRHLASIHNVLNSPQRGLYEGKEEVEESGAARKAQTRKAGGYKYGTGPKPHQGGPGKGADKEDDVYRNRQSDDGPNSAGNDLEGGSANIRRAKLVKSNVAARNLAAGVEYDIAELEEALVVSFLESYFGGELNEDTDDDDITNAIVELNATCNAVNEYFGVTNEIAPAVVGTALNVGAALVPALLAKKKGNGNGGAPAA